MPRPVVVPFLAALLLPLPGVGPQAAQAPGERFTERAFVTAIDVVAEVRDANGHTPEDLTPADFRLLESGVERKIIAVEYLDPSASDAPARPDRPATPAPATARPEWQIVVWFDAMTMSRATLNNAGRELARRAPDLLAFGPVTLVYADLSPEVMVGATRDQRAFASAVASMRKRRPGDRIAKVRREFLAATDNVTDAPEGIALLPKMGAPDRFVPSFIAEEERLLGIARRNLLLWLERIPRKSPRMLVYVGDGFDLDPGEFYVQTLQASGDATVDVEQLRSEVQAQTREANDAMAKRLAIGGWTALAIGGTPTAFADDVTRGSGRRFSGLQTGAAPPFVFLNPADPLIALAEETGGERIGSAAALPAALGALARRVRITYQVAREPDPEPRRIELMPLRSGLTVRASEWASSTTTEGVAEARAAELLGGNAARGDLPVTARLVPASAGDAEVEARVEFAPLAATAAQIGATKVRITIAVAISGEPPAVSHRIVEIADLASQAGLVWTAPIRIPENAGTIAVIAEELTTGSWGGARVAGTGEGAGAAVPAPAPSVPPAPYAALPAITRAQAFAAAAAERKLVVAFEWSTGCRGCDQIEKSAVEHPELAARLRSFVVLPSASAAWTGDPRIALYDPSGRLFAAWPAIREGRERNPLTAGDLTRILQRSAAAAPHALRAADLREERDDLESLMARALGLREAALLEEARLAYEEAEGLAGAAGLAAKAQTAASLHALMLAHLGRREDAERKLAAIVSAPATPLAEAEARLVLATIHRGRSDEKEAAREIERVLRLAPPDSEAYAAAVAISRGETGATSLAASNDPAARPLQVVVGGRPPFSGKTRLQVIVRDPEISAVEFRVDDARPTVDSAPPFEATIDLGRVPRRHEIRATARDRRGAIVAEDAMLLNERHDEFWIRLRPAAASGAMRAETSLPDGAKLARIEFFVDGIAARPLAGDPAAIRLPAGGEPALVRAVATLADGRTAEDATLVGATGYSETIEARDVELYVSVIDRDGTPAGALDRSQFTILEEGTKKRIAGFEFLGRAPFSVGLAIDSSSSMLHAMPEVHRTARSFLELATRDGSSGFVVDFDTTPRLAFPRSRDLPALQDAVSRIRADGSTALYDAIIFGLLQLQGVPGKRALVVLTDGKDETSRYGLEDAVRVARESGVAIYAIVLADAPAPRSIRAPAARGAAPGSPGVVYPTRAGRSETDPEIGTFALETGGRAWYLPEAGAMEAIYRSIDRELRNQYRITYRTSPGRGSSDWREVMVSVDVPGATVRAPAGFVAQ